MVDDPRMKICQNPNCGYVIGKLVKRPEMCDVEALYLTGTDVAIYDTEGECPKCGRPWCHRNSIFSLTKVNGRLRQVP